MRHRCRHLPSRCSTWARSRSAFFKLRPPWRRRQIVRNADVHLDLEQHGHDPRLEAWHRMHAALGRSRRKRLMLLFVEGDAETRAGRHARG